MCDLLSRSPRSRAGRVALLGPGGTIGGVGTVGGGGGVSTVGTIGVGQASLIVSIPVVCGGFASWYRQFRFKQKLLLQFLSVCRIANMTESVRMPASVASRQVREAARLVVESVAETAMGRSTKLNLEEVCAHLEINVADVRARAQQLQNA